MLFGERPIYASEADRFSNLNAAERDQKKLFLEETNLDAFSKKYQNIFINSPAPDAKTFYLYLGNIKVRKSDHHQLNANTFQNVVAKTNHQLVYDVFYTIDEFSHRRTINPKNSQNAPAERVATLGCSYTFGEGLNDEQTIASRLNSLSSKLWVTNWGIPGAGTSTVLRQLEENRSHDEKAKEIKKFIYIFIESHITRTLGILPTLTWNQDDTFYEEAENGAFEKHGSFRTGRPIKTALLLGIDFLFGKNILKDRVFPKISDSDISKICKMVKHLNFKSKNIAPESEFIFYYHPQSSTEYQNSLENCLKDSEIKFIKSSLELPDQKYRIPFDYHPNDLSAKKVAEELYSKIFIK